MAELTGRTQIFSGDTADIDTVQRFPFLTRAYDTSGNEYIYLTGVASTVAGSPVVYDEAGLTVLADSAGTAPANDGPVAIAMAATDSTSEYGWYQIFGVNTTAICNDNVGDNEQCYLTTTAGRIDDADVAGAAIIGMWFRSANAGGAGGTATVQLNYPSVHTDAVN